MSVALVTELDEVKAVLDRVKTWTPAGRIALVKGVVDTLAPEGQDGHQAMIRGTPPASRPGGRSLDEIIAILKGDRTAPETPAPEGTATSDGTKRGWPVEEALGLLKSDREPPDDEECRRIIEEERWRKYGP